MEGKREMNGGGVREQKGRKKWREVGRRADECQVYKEKEKTGGVKWRCGEGGEG